MNTMTQEPTRVLAGQTTQFDVRELVTGDAVVFAFLTLVLLVTGAVSGIVGVTALAALTGFAAIAITLVHSTKALAAADR